MRIDTQLAYVLHRRPFRDTSQIVDIFTRDHGRLSLMSKGSRAAKSKTRGILQAFRPLLVSWQGRGEMPLLCNVEIAEIRAPTLTGRALLSATYINELLVYLLHKHDIHSDTFDCYHRCLYELANATSLEVVLRMFEKSLLQQLGFALNLTTDADSGRPVEAGAHYHYYFEHGPVACQSRQNANQHLVVSGESLIAFEHDKLESVEQRAEIKALLRFIINSHLGHKKLKSRELFRRQAR